MESRLLIDTDVIIDYLRGVPEAVGFLEENIGSLYLSAICVAEIYAGIRPGRETENFQQFLTVFQVVPVDLEIARLGGLFRQKYGPSHGTGLADALIAATAARHQATLVTLNVKHFPMMQLHQPYHKS